MTRIEWTGVAEVQRAMSAYVSKVETAIRRVAQYWQAVFESYAKSNARWQDRTGNARQHLHAYIGGEAPSRPGTPEGVAYPDTDSLASDTVELYLSHGMNYGVELETHYAGRYAIVWETIEIHLSELKKMLDEVFG